MASIALVLLWWARLNIAGTQCTVSSGGECYTNGLSVGGGGGGAHAPSAPPVPTPMIATTVQIYLVNIHNLVLRISWIWKPEVLPSPWASVL